MKKISQKTQRQNVLSLIDNRKFQANRSKNNLFSYRATKNQFQFQIGDAIICRTYLGERLAPNDLVIDESENGGKRLTTVSGASNISAVVVAFKRDIVSGYNGGRNE